MGLFDSKKTEKTQSSQQGRSWNDLSDDATNYWSTVAPTFQQGWTPVANDPNQTAAAGAQAGLSARLNPAFDTATGIGASGISTADIQRFQNPYEDQVVRDTLDDMRYADSQALSQSNAAAAKAGALGGTSGIVRRNLLEDNFQDARNKAVTGIRQAGFNTAADLAAKSTSAQLAGVGAASGIAGQQSGINQTQFGMGTQGWNQAWQNANQPYQVAQQGASTLGALSGAAGQHQSGSSTGTSTTTAQPGIGNTLMNAAGMALKAYMASDERVKEDIIPIGESFDGQPIYEFNYKGDPRRTIGLLAQDVEEHAPEAVTEVDGVKMVDYDRALKDSKPGRSMSGGGAVGGDSQGEKDPHSKFRSAFEAITGMLSKARGGAVSGLTPPGRAAGGPAMGVWDTTVTPAAAPASGNPAMSGLADDMMKFGKDDGQQQGGSALGAQQQALSSMLSGMRRPGRPFGGAVWGETGPQFEDTRPSALEPPAYASAGAEPVMRRELPPARPGSPFPSDEGSLLTAIKGFEGYNPRAYSDYKQHSVGYGTRARHPGEVIDKAEADRRLADEVARARGIVDKFAPNIDPGTRAALTSLTYNAGDDWTRAGLGEAIRTGNMDEARRRFVQYNKAGGEELPGLVARRRAEAAWMGGLPPASGGASIPTSGRGEVVASGDATGSDDPKAFLDRLYPKSRMSAGLNALADGMLAWKDPLFGSRTEGMAQHFAKKTADEANARMEKWKSDREADQFAKRLARERDIALGKVDGLPTVAARQADAAIAEADVNRKVREAGLTGTYDGKPTVAGRAQESDLKTADLKRDLAEIELDAKKNPERIYERRAAVADKYGLTRDQRTQFIIDGKIPDKTAATESTETKEVTKAAVENAQKDIVAAQAAKDSMKWVDELYGVAADPGLESAIGFFDGSPKYQSVAGSVGFGNPQLNAKIVRIQKQLELAGGQEMKGLGAQSETDAARLQEAIGNLTSARDKKEFMDALSIIESKVSSAYNKGVSAAKRFPAINPDLSKAYTRDLAVRAEAREAIAEAKRKGKDIRQQVIDQLRADGIDPTGI